MPIGQTDRQTDGSETSNVLLQRSRSSQSSASPWRNRGIWKWRDPVRRRRSRCCWPGGCAGSRSPTCVPPPSARCHSFDSQRIRRDVPEEGRLSRLSIGGCERSSLRQCRPGEPTEEDRERERERNRVHNASIWSTSESSMHAGSKSSGLKRTRGATVEAAGAAVEMGSAALPGSLRGHVTHGRSCSL